MTSGNLNRAPCWGNGRINRCGMPFFRGSYVMSVGFRHKDIFCRLVNLIHWTQAWSKKTHLRRVTGIEIAKLKKSRMSILWNGAHRSVCQWSFQLNFTMIYGLPQVLPECIQSSAMCNIAPKQPHLAKLKSGAGHSSKICTQDQILRKKIQIIFCPCKPWNFRWAREVEGSSKPRKVSSPASTRLPYVCNL